jgi:hypothetical protein
LSWRTEEALDVHVEHPSATHFPEPMVESL